MRFGAAEAEDSACEEGKEQMGSGFRNVNPNLKIPISIRSQLWKIIQCREVADTSQHC